MRHPRGQSLFLVVSFLGIISIFTVALLSYVMQQRVVTVRYANKTASRNVAEAGLHRAQWCLNHPEVCGSGYTGETAAYADGEYTTSLSSVGNTYAITSTATVNGVETVVRATATTESTIANASFFYGVQVGAGGLTMDNNSHIDGNVYSNGNITGGSGAYITGDVYVAGGTALTANQEQLTQTGSFSFGNADTTADFAQSFKPSISEQINYISLYVKKVGSPSNATVYITEDNNNNPQTTSIAQGTLVATQVTGSYGWVTVSFASNPTLTANSRYWIVIDTSPKSGKYFIIGTAADTAYANGTHRYSNNWAGGSWSAGDADATFQIWLGGINTSITGLQVGDIGHTCDDTHYATHHGDAHAHQILNSWVECDAYYATDPDDISGTTVGRVKHPDSDDPAPEAMPISDGQITEWKDVAATGDITTGDLTLSDGQIHVLGPARVTGNLTITNNTQVTITGTVWVEGDILLSNNVIFSLASGYGSNSGLVVTDGRLTVSNNVIFNGSGAAGSFLMILSTDPSTDPSSPAIDINNNANTVIFYASEGLINVANNALLKEATGYALHLSNGARVTYESGLANALFANGPGGIWTIQESTWQEL